MHFTTRITALALSAATFALFLGAACMPVQPRPVQSPPIPTAPLVQPTVPAQPAACALSPIVAPTAAPDPGYTKQDMSTGLHMTGTPQSIDVATYRLEVTGKVAHPLSLTFDEIRCLPRVAASPRLVCPGFFIDTYNWAGASLSAVLALAQPTADARYVELIGADGYSSLPEIERALDPANFLAYEWEGQPVPVLHGFPVRVVMPAEEGNRWVKWLVKIDVR